MSQTTHLTRRGAAAVVTGPPPRPSAASAVTPGRHSIVRCVASKPNFRYSARMPRLRACVLPVRWV